VAWHVLPHARIRPRPPFVREAHRACHHAELGLCYAGFRSAWFSFGSLSPDTSSQKKFTKICTAILSYESVLPEMRRNDSLPSGADTLHLFSPQIAQIYGLEAAVVYQHIKWVCIRQHKYQIKKNRLMEIFPYLGRDQLVAALAALLDLRKKFAPALLERVDEKRNPTYRLRVSTKSKKLHSFDPKMAIKYGIAAAVIYDDILRWIVINDEKISTDEQPSHYESPAQWVKIHHYVPLRTVERAFNLLKSAKELRLLSRMENRVPLWTIRLGRGKMNRWKALHKSKPKEKVNKTEKIFVYVPVLADDDNRDENRHRQNPSSDRQKPSSEGN
jgi:hypothetical protein